MKLHSFYNLILFRLQLAGCFLLVGFTAFSQQTLRTNLYVVGLNGSKTLMDGNMTIYDDIYCNCVNWEDALKMSNPGENWGLVRSGTTLAVERRKFIPETDTSYIRMWNLQQRNFVIEVIGHNLAKTDRIGYVRDNYNNVNTPIYLADTTYINFSVTSDSRTSAQDRFSIIFEKAVQQPIPVTFTSIKLLRKNNLVNIEFSVENELNVSSYVLQHAIDTLTFKNVKAVVPTYNGGSQMYKESTDDIRNGDNFYRVKAISTDGKIIYSSVAKLFEKLQEAGINVYPNPIVTRTFQINMNVIKEGKYDVRLIGINGNVYQLAPIQMTQLKSSQSILLPANLKSGIYSLHLIGPANTIFVKSITILL